jgi:hypothetical protein
VRLIQRLREPRVLLPAVLALALAVPAAYEAGYTRGGRSIFVALAGLALVAAAVADEEGAIAALRSPPAIALAALAALGAISAAWTIVRPVDSVLSGLVVAGYCGMAVAAGTLARRRRGVVAIAAAIAVLAALEALVGLGAAALRELPYAQRIGGSWRAGGTFEYSAALALLEVTALPALLAAMMLRRRVLASGGAAAGVLAAGVLATSASRIELALGIAIVALALALPRATAGRSRVEVVAAVALLGIGGAIVRLAIGGYAAPHDIGGGAARIAGLIAVAAVAGALWPVLRAALERRRERVPVAAGRPARAAAVLAALALAAAGFAAATASTHGRGIEPSAGFLHGRSEQWSAAWQTFLDRPAGGAGAESFLAASAQHQGGAPVRYAHDLPLESAAELGLAGLLIAIAVYATAAVAVWRSRRSPQAWLVAPGVAAFLIANLVDWEWHLPLAGAVWALGLGGLIGLGLSNAPRVLHPDPPAA